MPEQPDVTPFKWGVDEYVNLYQASPLLSLDNKKTLGLVMPVDVFLQDPLVVEQAKRSGEVPMAGRPEWKPINTIYVPCEPDLIRGPTSARIAVVDYDADTGILEAPVEWDSKEQRFFFTQKKDKVYLTAEHSDLPQFHQVNVWAVVQSVLGMYEQAFILGRSAPWGFDGNRLLLVPHAGELQNAFYDRSSKSIQFYYFSAGGKKVFTCLSHDIIAHETGHAILDGLRPYYLEDSSIQTAAFHEFIADTTALMAAFLNNELRFHAAQASGGDLSRDEIISGLAEEFGYYSYGRPYLRSAQNRQSITKVKASNSPYDWSQVLTGVMFDILKEILVINKSTPRANGSLPSLQQSFMNVCNRFRRIAFQPLDYLPPVDVQFSDYARAVLRADEIVEPVDEHGYRKVMKKVFKKRGIEYEEQAEAPRLNFYAYDIDRLTRSRTEAYHFLNENRRQLCIPGEQDVSVVDLYQTNKLALDQERGRLPREIVVQYVWREDVELKGKEYGSLDGERASLLCGGTLVFDSRGNILSWQRKPGLGKQETGPRLRKCCQEEHDRGAQRVDELLAYLRERVASGAVALEERSRPDEVGQASPVVARHGADGSLRLGITPHLRHWDGG